MLICGWFLTTNFTNRTNNCFVESRWICVSPWSKGAEEILWDFPPTKAKTARSARSVWTLVAKVRKNSVRFPTHQSKNREIREIRVSPWSKVAEKILWDFPPTKAKTVRSARSVWALGAKERKNSVRFPTHQSKNREIREICVSPWSKGAEKILWDFPPTKAKNREIREICVRHRISCGIFGLCGEKLVT